MRERLNADYKTLDFDPMRLAQPITAAEKDRADAGAAGPDWLACVGNWMTSGSGPATRSGGTRFSRAWRA